MALGHFCTDIALFWPYSHYLRPIFTNKRLIRNFPQMNYLYWCAWCSWTDLMGGWAAPEKKPPISYLFLKCFYLTSLFCHSLVMCPILRKVRGLPLMFVIYINVKLHMYMQGPIRLSKLKCWVPYLYAQHHGFYSCY